MRQLQVCHPYPHHIQIGKRSDIDYAACGGAAVAARTPPRVASLKAPRRTSHRPPWSAPPPLAGLAITNNPPQAGLACGKRTKAEQKCSAASNLKSTRLLVGYACLDHQPLCRKRGLGIMETPGAALSRLALVGWLVDPARDSLTQPCRQGHQSCPSGHRQDLPPGFTYSQNWGTALACQGPCNISAEALHQTPCTVPSAFNHITVLPDDHLSALMAPPSTRGGAAASCKATRRWPSFPSKPLCIRRPHS